MPAQAVPSTPVPTTSVEVTKLETAVLEKFQTAIARGHHLPKVLKDLSAEELDALKVQVDGEIARRKRVSSYAIPAPTRAWTPSTA